MLIVAPKICARLAKRRIANGFRVVEAGITDANLRSMCLWRFAAMDMGLMLMGMTFSQPTP